MDKVSGIYCLFNKVNEKRYVGKATNIDFRIKVHLKDLTNNSHYNEHLQNSWNKYGGDSFECLILEFCDKELLSDREIFYIKKYNSKDQNFGYNKTKGGEGTSGYVYTESQREKRSGKNNPMFGKFGESHPAFGYKQLEEVKEKLRILKTGVPRPQHVIDVLRSFTWKGRIHPQLGRKHTDEEKQKMKNNHQDYSGENHPQFGKKRENCSSKYFGVSRHKRNNNWVAYIQVKGERVFLGSYNDEFLAGKAYNKYVVENNLPNPLNLFEHLDNENE